MLTLPLLLSLLGTAANAAVTIYNVTASSSTSAVFTQPTGNSAYSPLILVAPNPPGGLQKDVPIVLQTTTPAGVSIGQKGSFLGFSVELSVADAVLGYNSTVLNPPFLNYLANIKERAGHGPTVRVGGNSQDESAMFPTTFTDAFGHQRMIQKWRVDNGNPTETPNINFAIDLFYTMGNISALVDADWYFGLAFDQPYNDSNAMLVARTAEETLGHHLIAMQLGNEPDLYAGHGRRTGEYGIPEYFTEYSHFLGDLQAQNLPEEKIILGPSVCCTWSTQQVLDAGYIQQYGNWLKVIGVMHYPANNCGISGVINPQDIFPNYLTHKSAQTFVQNYITTAPSVINAGLPFVVLETNTASCGGFPGLSDSFGAALWGIDSAFALAAMNFSQVLLHVGGQSTSYNPFTPPPTKMSKDHLWTTGAIYYSTLVVAEAFGKSNASQIIDLNLPSEFQPGYAIYENGVPTRVALINFVTDASGASDFNGVISFNGGTVPDHVSVRYLEAPSVSEKFNIKWAGQNMGSAIFTSDGRLTGDVQTIVIPCDQAANNCVVPVKAPSVALVFLSDDALSHSSPEDPASSLTFATSVFTARGQHPIIDPAVLKTMNGDGGVGPRHTGSTSKGQSAQLLGAAARSAAVPALVSVFALALGVMLVAGRG
ncbi:hypothetical protein FRC04_010552 [Tulasnella sp. 424]|nr:hypothetical protein FRC04_010552 [Tulasnella sp. 424]KAG8972291.1 hypothetical protein FRC05_010133 [Tulasnella sp. 425]